MTTKSPLPGPKTLLMGPTGTGKTSAIATLIDCGVTPMCIFTEPSFEVLGEVPEDKLHWHFIPQATQSFAALAKMANTINNMTFEGLTKMSGMNKQEYNQLEQVLKLCNNFVCQRTGEDFGDAAKWNTDRCLVIDSFTGLSSMAMANVVGNKPVRSQPDWGMAQNQLEFILNTLTSLTCGFVLIGHIEREVDEVLGGIKLMITTLGKKLAPKVPLNFSDVVLATRVGEQFTWDTVNPQADLKARNLPLRAGQVPSFVPIYESWKRRGGLLLPTT